MFFFTILLNFFVSPWSPCQNATYVFEEEKIFSILVKGHPGEIFSTFIISSWSQCQKRRQQVKFWESKKIFSLSPWSPCRNAIYESEKKIFCSDSERPPFWKIFYFYHKSVKSMPKTATTFFFTNLLNFFVSPWSPCQNATYVFEEEKIFSILVKCGIFSSFIISPWSQCQKRRPQVKF